MTTQRELERAVRRVKNHFTDNTVLADFLDITRQAVDQWTDKIPVARVLAVEKLTGIPRHELRPDIYPPPQAAVQQ